MRHRVIAVMSRTKHRPTSSLAVALDLLEALGDRAVVASRVRLVETIAANDRPAAAFWLAVLRHCERQSRACPAVPPDTAARTAARPAEGAVTDACDP